MKYRNTLTALMSVWLAAASVLCNTACTGGDEKIDDGGGVAGFLNVGTSGVDFEEESAQPVTVTVKSNKEWTATASHGWIHADKVDSGLRIAVDDNDDKSVREGRVDIAATGDLAYTIAVRQLGWGKEILLSSPSASVAATGAVVEVGVTTNFEVVAVPDGDWIAEKSDQSTRSHPVTTSVRTFVVSANGSESQRSGSIEFRDPDSGSDFEPKRFGITQAGLGVYVPDAALDIKDDIKVKITGGEASSYQQGEGIELSFDGDMSTIYHSNWNNGGANYFPITLTYYFDRADMDYMVYYPRPTGYNGFFEMVDIEVRTNANTRAQDEWQFVMSYDFGGRSSASKVDFPQPLIGVSAIRMTVKSGYGDGQGFASCAEMEFYRRNPDNFDYSTLFTDMTCSELRAGVTDSDIAQCRYSFFSNLAYYMLHDRYDTEFRVNTFRAYPHPNTQAAQNKTTQYSLLDNPTGISVSAGDDLIVLADLKGQGITLRVQNLDVPGGDGFGGVEYPLASGVNKLKMTTKGLVYVMYHTAGYQSAPQVKLHFASGRVNGYYDSQNPAHDGRAKELLNAATDAYFDVVGKYAHLTFPTQRFRNHTKDLRRLIDAYDSIVYSEQLLMGLEHYGKMFANRMYFNVMYHSYMYSTSYHTDYHDDTLAELCDEEKLTTSACWGPAHEVGHSNQTGRGLKWIGLTEVTNNIMSEYVQTTIFKQNSRVQTESMGDAANPNRYSKAWNGIIVPGLSHAVHGDVFCKLIPFWQLELYFGKVLGRTPLEQSDRGGFYPDCYEYVRTHDDITDDGACQLEFVYIASRAAGMNLTRFFERWGFFTPVSVEIDDYAVRRLTVTEAMADNMRQRVAALGLPEPEVPIEYLTDNNWAAVKARAAVVAGTASRSGQTLTMDNWQNVLVYEVRDGGPDGRVIHISDGMLTPSTRASFKVPESWNNGWRLYAVQYDGRRIEVALN